MLNQRGWLRRCLCWGVLVGKTLTELDRLFWSILFWALEWFRFVFESARETYRTGRVSDHCLAGGQFLAIYAICKMAFFHRLLKVLSSLSSSFRLSFWRCSSKARFTTWHEIRCGIPAKTVTVLAGLLIEQDCIFDLPTGTGSGLEAGVFYWVNNSFPLLRLTGLPSLWRHTYRRLCKREVLIISNSLHQASVGTCWLNG